MLAWLAGLTNPTILGRGSHTDIACRNR